MELRMGAPGIDKLFPNILKWIHREEWRDRFAQVFDDHLGSVCDEFDLEIEDLAAEIGVDLFEPVITCVIDDFLTCNFEPDGQNVVEDYLKRRGWKESERAKRYLQAMKRSIMSLYEVTETRPGKCLFVRDLLRGGEPICVDDRKASESAAKWDRLAARVLQVNGKDYFAPGILLFPMESAEELLEDLGQVEDDSPTLPSEPTLNHEGSEDDISQMDVTLDTINAWNDMVRLARARIEKETGVPEANIMVAASHNHSGPNLKGMDSLSGTERDHLVEYADQSITASQSVTTSARISSAG